jgi:hypothetical protein
METVLRLKSYHLLISWRGSELPQRLCNLSVLQRAMQSN